MTVQGDAERRKWIGLDERTERERRTEPPVDWQSEATIWRDAYLDLIEHALDVATAIQARAPTGLGGPPP